MGPPGAGKGTQAKVVATHFGVPAVSTGDIFRANVANKTALGVEAQRYMEAGEYVPDSVTNAMVRDRLGEEDAKKGFLLRSEERRVGKECRSRCSPYHYKKYNIYLYYSHPSTMRIT